MELLAIAFVVLAVAGLLVRAVWEKRNHPAAEPDPHAEAVGGWFGN